jgi:myo-inositol-1(or 4)-monophosphatase
MRQKTASKDERDMIWQTDLEENLLRSAIEYAKEAGDLIRKRIGNSGPIREKKNRSDLVTEVDQLSETFLRNKIKQEYPGHWILSEEDNGQENSYMAFRQNGPGYGWIIDPIDGTTNFIHGVPHFSVSIGIVRAWETVIGVVYNPVTDELFYARRNFGAFRNGETIRVGSEKRIGDALLATGFQAVEWKHGSTVLRQINQLAGICRNIRLFGAASLDLCWVASGRLTGFWHAGLNPWDTAAGILILLEAGGQATDWHGNPYRLDHPSLVASNGKVHTELLRAIQI